jgi:hypothetical protein
MTRIHFAINSLLSCPNLLNEAYTEAKLNQQLAAVAKVLSTIKLKTPSANKIEISKIFDWFEGDFKTKGSV